MHYGVNIFPTEYSISMMDLGRDCEERGFESIWVAEHSHIPTSRKSPFPVVATCRRCTTTPSTRSWR